MVALSIPIISVALLLAIAFVVAAIIYVKKR